jgi:hypothetical protein
MQQRVSSEIAYVVGSGVPMADDEHVVLGCPATELDQGPTPSVTSSHHGARLKQPGPIVPEHRCAFRRYIALM